MKNQIVAVALSLILLIVLPSPAGGQEPGTIIQLCNSGQSEGAICGKTHDQTLVYDFADFSPAYSATVLVVGPLTEGQIAYDVVSMSPGADIAPCEECAPTWGVPLDTGTPYVITYTITVDTQGLPEYQTRWSLLTLKGEDGQVLSIRYYGWAWCLQCPIYLPLICKVFGGPERPPTRP